MRHSFKSLFQLMPKITKDATGKMAMNFGALMFSWENVVGSEVAAHTMIEKITPITTQHIPNQPNQPKISPYSKTVFVVHLSVHPGFAMECQYRLETIKAQINSFLGYAAIDSIKLIQNFASAPLGASLSAKRPKEISMETQEKLEQTLSSAGIDDEALSAALLKFGTALMKE